MVCCCVSDEFFVFSLSILGQVLENTFSSFGGFRMSTPSFSNGLVYADDKAQRGSR